ncbi:MAG: LysR family transcriptional regulator [Prevotella sp.]
MEIRQLKFFLKVAETLNFSEASRKLFISQSTLSQQISHLENEIGLPLFERNSHEVYLSEAGKELLPYARTAVMSTDACLEHMNDLKQMLTGELNLGVTHSFSNIMMENIIDFLHTYPKVKLNIEYKSMQELMDNLKQRKLDLVLAFKPNKIDKMIDSRSLFNNRLAAIVREDHCIAQMSHVKLNDLQRFDFILPSKGLQARNAFEQLIENKDLNFHIKMEANNVSIIFDLLHRSNYVSILSESTVVQEKGLRAVPINDIVDNMEGCVHFLKNSYMKKSAQEFIRIMSQSTSILANLSFMDILK